MAVTVGVLEALPLFSGIDRDRLEHIVTRSRSETIPQGKTIITESEPANDPRVVLSGRVSVAIRIPGAADLTITTLSRGELLGWSALLEDQRWVASAKAIKTSELLTLPGAALRRLCQNDHELGYHLMRNAFICVASRLKDTRIQCVDMFGCHE